LPLLGFELKKTARTWLHIGLIFWWVLLFYSASRGVLLAWFVGMFITALVYQKSSWPFLRLQLIQITAGFLSYILLFKAIPALLNYTLVTGTVLRDSASDRLGLWRQALLLVNESPLFGVGPMHFAWHYDTSAHPHNSVLQLAAEFGLPATLIVLLIASYGIYCWLKRFNVSSLRTQSAVDKHLIIILFFTIVSNALYSLVDGVIVMPISQVLMFTVIGLMIGHYAYGPKTNDENKSKFRPIIAGFVLLTMLWSTLPEITQGLSGNEKGFSMGYTAAGPRFWREIK
jgi:O-antigen ligase